MRTWKQCNIFQPTALLSRKSLQSARSDFSIFQHFSSLQPDFCALGWAGSLFRMARSPVPCIRSFVLTAGLGLASSGRADAGYVMVDLGDLGGGYSQARAINVLGQVVGEGLVANAVAQHAVSWQSGSISDLGTLGGDNSRALAINNNGTVGGWAQNASGDSQAALWNGSNISALPTLGGPTGTVWGINSAGTAVGNSDLSSGANHATLWNGNGALDLGTLGGAYSVAYSINDQGVVVGTGFDSAGNDRACLWGSGGPVNLGNLSGGDWTAAREINNSGQMILWGTPSGGSGNHASFWNGDSQSPVIDLGTFGGTESWAYGLNNTGDVVGWATEANGTYHAFVWNGTTMTDLGTLGGPYSSAYAINDQGIVVGDAMDAFGNLHAVEWLPVPEPKSVILFLGGIFALWTIRRRSRR